MDPWLDPAEITTERLSIRATTRDDLPVMERTWLDPKVRRYLGGPISAEMLERRRQTQPGRGMFTVTVDGATVVGFCTYGRTEQGDLELSYSFLPEHWGHGYAREACAAVLGWGFANVAGTERIVAITQAANLRSIRLLKALNMVKVDEFMQFDAPQVMYAAYC
ncbi:GNAT family N-acetyltransferase [Nonomuraea diastatica]|uniref:N-acetyltransferase n=1 Tax=Nonomuraea diastatica TaxID=1848329 RepID=A0A4R4WT48_9ACTN|nr:GNAT family N-acetyltransferase [Nonomuraea diastatica]TDD20748.1 N-acetyltransferase [Nonomuraea diastatica]